MNSFDKLLAMVLYIVGAVAVIAALKATVENYRNTSRNTSDDAPRIRHIPISTPENSANRPHWSIAPGLLCFYAGFMPLFLGFNVFFILFVGIPILTPILTRIFYKKINLLEIIIAAGIVLEAIIAFPIKMWHRQLIYEHQDILFTLMGVGFLMMVLSVFLLGRKRRHSWLRVQAKCIDKEIFMDSSMDDTWSFQILCEFELDGEKYRVTPVFWRTFATKSGVSRFLSRRINTESICELHVNPENPLETELVGRDIKDFLLHRK